VLLHAHDIKFLDLFVLYDVRFSNMSTEWGGYHLHPLFESCLPSSSSPLWATLMSLTILMGNAQFASFSAERTRVVRRGYLVCPMSPFLFGCRVVTLMTFPLVTMLRKGPFHLERRVYHFVLPGLRHSYRFCCL
jgi:hypothetical protein